MSSHHHNHPATPGRVDSSTLLCGTVGLLLAVAMFWVGLLGKGDQRILDMLSQPVFRGTDPTILDTRVLIGLTLLACFGLSFAVLDSAGTWRRVVLGVTVLILVAALVPVLAVWEIYFPPMMTLVGVFWSWFCAMMYVSHHEMPCELLGAKPTPVKTKKVDAPSAAPAKAKPVAEQPTTTKAKKKKRKASDADDKYKPKDLIDG
ncbi:hypothetical protein JO972_00750 [Verrucomicrobiaceae bacterium 5K15]|uniref:Uncharacterized protein n=1 Tax=Oceaniferula flava TaxID=2800421 RepID=A0AAE2S9F4_9BACT|nr:hypothetical protein [Oceaniferula flavus]MBK1853478.1 hypothetical protein [Oceaniferula flavus]MBM1134783.1 hypothetical protein [Oceaniferula flavus]